MAYGAFVNGDTTASLGGTLAVTTDAALGPIGSPITVGGVGTLSYTGTTATARTFNLNFGTLAVSGGTTLTMSGATVIV